MNKKASIIAGTLLVVLAIVLGFVLVNKGDGPVMNLVIANRAIMGEAFKEKKVVPDEGVYLIVEKEFNKFKEKYSKTVPSGEDFYATIYAVECPKGTVFTSICTVNGNIVKEQKKTLETDQRGVIVFVMENNVPKGNAALEIFVEGKSQLKVLFQVK